MNNKSKGFFIFVCFALITFSLSLSNSLAAKRSPSKKDSTIPVYQGATYIKTYKLKDGTLKKQYCSKDALKFIKKYYKRKYPNAVEVIEGRKHGDIHILLLDVKSPLEKNKSRKSISIFDTKKKGKCRTLIWIKDYPAKKAKKPAKVKPAEKPKKIVKKPSKVVPPPEKKVTPMLPSKNIMGIGAAANVVNTSAGASFILWPFSGIGIQGNYGIGKFTSYEAKLLLKINLNYPIKPYFGGGYLHAEKDDTILGEDITIEADSYSVFAGIEYKLNNNFALYLDIAGTPLTMEDEFIIGATKVKAEADYSSVTTNLNMVYYFW